MLRKRVLNIDTRFCDRVPTNNPDEAAQFPAAFQFSLLNPVRRIVRMSLDSVTIIDASGGVLQLRDPYYLLRLDDHGNMEHQTGSRSINGSIIKCFAKLVPADPLRRRFAYENANLDKDYHFEPTKELRQFNEIRLLRFDGSTVPMLSANAYMVITLELWEEAFVS
jgi:hypothetical protein